MQKATLKMRSTMKTNSFFFIGDLIESDIKLPIHLFDNFYLNRANNEQIRFIKSNVDHYVDLLPIKINKYESSFTLNKKDGYAINDLENPNKKYFIIEFPEIQAKKPLPLIFSLSAIDLSLLFESSVVFKDSKSGQNVYGTFQSQLRTVNYFIDNHSILGVLPEIKKITPLAIREVQEIHLKLNQFNADEYPFIQKALNDFISIKDISKNSPFKILSCFAILELLLTSYKTRGLNGNSISHQLKKKINLLNNQFEEKIDFQKYFKGPDTNTLETIIEKLYQFRNDIAHGNFSDFESELKVLKNNTTNILDFLVSILKKILIVAIEFPQLVKDLKEC